MEAGSSGPRTSSVEWPVSGYGLLEAVRPDFPVSFCCLPIFFEVFRSPTELCGSVLVSGGKPKCLWARNYMCNRKNKVPKNSSLRGLWLRELSGTGKEMKIDL